MILLSSSPILTYFFAAPLHLTTSLWGLESQTAKITDRTLGDVNATVSEIKLELEIILLENFETTSALLDAKTENLMSPVAPILDAYNKILRELVPDLDLSDDALSRMPTMARRTDMAAPPDLHAKEHDMDGWSDSASAHTARGSSTSGVLSASLLVLGALFAGVGVAANRMAQVAERERETQYENLL
jgi:hypothetical protein